VATSEPSRPRTGLSRSLHRVGAIAEGERAGTVVGVIVVLWVASYVVTGFPEWMAEALQVTAAATTLVMVFVILHMQRRTELATQLKLDELLRGTDADDSVAQIEVADGDVLERRHAEAQRR
jgi:low affinity Fe/Cu permease